MTYFTEDETRRILEVAYAKNRKHHAFLVTHLVHATRVAEACGITARDVDTTDNSLRIMRLKKGGAQYQPMLLSDDPIFSESGLLQLAKERPVGRLFGFTPRRVNQFLHEYCEAAGVPRRKAHSHSFRHTTAMRIFETTGSLGQVSSYLAHRSPASSLSYLAEVDHKKAQVTVAGIFGRVA